MMKKLMSMKGLLLCTIMLSSCFETAALIGGSTAAGTVAWFSYERRPTVGLVNDALRQNEFSSLVRKNEQLRDRNIYVTSFNNKLIITGQLKSMEEKQTLKKMLEDYACTGIKKYYDETTIGKSEDNWSSYHDFLITTRIKGKILYHYKDPSHVKVTTSNGTVYLMGIVSKKEAEEAVKIACNTEGVKKVVKIFDVNY